ncbi:MAG: 2-oxoisovalerate dehydrogenase [Daejeonella sp.]|uniref:2-oxoisovalerate dehydrogenase n=1 Tax=Daejeonella sp. TaxID=2805397 RepID=UPI003C787ECC
MKELFFLVEEALEGGYTAKAIGESIFSEAETIDQLKIDIREAVECHFEPNDKPQIIRLHMVKEEMIIL